MSIAVLWVFGVVTSADLLEPSQVVHAASVSSGRPPMALHGGARSIESLIDRFLAALEARDEEALEGLRVSEEEYRQIIVPGRVPKGAEARHPAKRNVDYFWGVMDYKSDMYAANLIRDFGGRAYTERHLELTRNANEWAWYTAHGEVRLLLVPPGGQEKYLLRTGWIVEVDGAFKFLSYEYDG